MKLMVRELTCAIALGALAVALPAQANETSKMSGAKPDMMAQADADYKAAKDACDAKKGAEKDKCLKDADAAHAKAIKGSASMSSSSTKDMSSSSTSTHK